MNKYKIGDVFYRSHGLYIDKLEIIEIRGPINSRNMYRIITNGSTSICFEEFLDSSYRTNKEAVLSNIEWHCDHIEINMAALKEME